MGFQLLFFAFPVNTTKSFLIMNSPIRSFPSPGRIKVSPRDDLTQTPRGFVFVKTELSFKVRSGDSSFKDVLG